MLKRAREIKYVDEEIMKTIKQEEKGEESIKALREYKKE